MRQIHTLILATALAAMALSPGARAATPPPHVGDTFRVLRLYAGHDGESHIDTIDLPTVDRTPGQFVQSRLFSTDVELGESVPGTFIDWHGVSSPRFLIILSGQIEIGLGDGSKHVLHAGDMVLATDMTGHGHTSRSIGSEIVRSLTVRLPRDDALAPKLNPCPPGLPDALCVAARQQATARQAGKQP